MTKVGTFLALLSGAVTLLALGFQLGDYQNPDLAKVCYALAGIFLVGAFVALFWPSKSGSTQELETQRRKRIEDWRFAIRDFDFGTTERFAGTDTYSQMRPYLKPDVIEMFETPRGIFVGNEARGDPPYRHTLLDEVARIEKEWGLT